MRATGICVGSQAIHTAGLIMAKSVSCVSLEHTVPVKVFNPNDHPIDIKRNFFIGYFRLLDPDCLVTPMFSSHKQTSVNQTETLNHKDKTTDQQTFFNNFDPSNIHHLDSSQQQEIKGLLWSYKDIFVTKENPTIGLTPLVQHTIHVDSNAKLPHQRLYCLSPDKKVILRHQLEELIARGVITPVQDTEKVPITSPIVLVSKPKARVSPGQSAKEVNLAQWRFCTDFRALNKVTTDSHYNIPDIQDLLESFAEHRPNYITCLDLSHGFHQISVDPSSTKFTAFNTCFGTYKYLRLPMGLKTSPNTMQLLMDRVLQGFTFKSCLSYLDDVLITSSSFHKHLAEVGEVFDRLREANLKTGPAKCSFAQQKSVFFSGT